MASLSASCSVEFVFSAFWLWSTFWPPFPPLRFGSPLPPRDVKPTYAPPVQATAMVRYEWETSWGLMHARASAHYSDSFFYNLRNFAADQFGAYTMVNAGLGWSSNNDSGSWRHARWRCSSCDRGPPEKADTA